LVTIMTGTAQWHILCTSWIRWSDMAGRGATVRKVSHQELFPSFDRQRDGGPRRHKRCTEQQRKGPIFVQGPCRFGEPGASAEFKQQEQTTF
jgi:hypothetical protein